ncbi:VOC family protein [Roseateles chitinivorans]|uniref:VOC family protein n=1 Tax=Roseateles chitinivorans TaxID=2917965 RepID=UPI003D67A80C
MPHDPGFLSGTENPSMPAATVIPVLHYPDVAAAVAWLVRVFGFTERLRIGDHRVQMTIGNGAIVVAHGDAPVDPEFSLMVRVASADQHASRATAEGAELHSQPQSFPYGERQYTASDLAGYVWTFSQSERDVDPGTWGGELLTGRPDKA